jgi:hypothetical protein
LDPAGGNRRGRPGAASRRAGRRAGDRAGRERADRLPALSRPDRTKGAIFVAARGGTGERQLTTAPGKASDDFPTWRPTAASSLSSAAVSTPAASTSSTRTAAACGASTTAAGTSRRGAPTTPTRRSRPDGTHCVQPRVRPHPQRRDRPLRHPPHAYRRLAHPQGLPTRDARRRGRRAPVVAGRQADRFRPPQRHRQAGRRAGRLRDQSPRHRASARHAVPDQGLATAPTGRPTARRSSSAAPRPRTSCAATSGRSTPTAPLCGGPARRPADKGLLGVILPRRHGDHPPVGRGRRSDDVAGGANGRPCDVLGLAHLGTDAHLGAQPRRLRERTLRKFRDSSPPTGGRPPPASAYRCAGGRVGGQARHACCGRAPGATNRPPLTPALPGRSRRQCNFDPCSRRSSAAGVSRSPPEPLASTRLR